MNVYASSLIWNDPLSNPDLSIVAGRQRQQASACWRESLRSRDGRGVQGRRRRRPEGAQPWMPCPSRDTSHAAGARAAKTTDDRGRFDDESR